MGSMRRQRPLGVAHSSDGTLYVVVEDGLHEIRSADGVVVSRLAPSFGLGQVNGRPEYCHLHEKTGLLYVSTK